MKPQVGDLRTVTQRFDGKEWVLCLQSMPPKELSDDEIAVLKEIIRISDRKHPLWDKAKEFLK